jgi:MFS family permease
MMLMAFGLFFVRAGATNVLVPAFGDRVLSMSPAAVGAVISAGSLVSLAMMAPAGRIADLRGRRPVALAGVFSTAGAVTLFGLASNPASLLGASAAVGVGMGLASVALPTMVGDIAPSGTEGLASGLYRIANDLGWVAGPLVLGWLADMSRFGLGFVVSGIPIAAGGLLFASRPAPSDKRPVHTSRTRAGRYRA